MKRIFYIMVTMPIGVILFISCSTTYVMIAPEESFDALTKITDNKNPSIFPNGGDYGKNLVFCVIEEGKYTNVYMKDNVLTSSIIKKTTGSNNNLAPNISTNTNKIAFQYWDKDNYDIYYIDAYQGKAITQITSTDENEFSPDWSPDGSKIVFERGAPPRFYIAFRKEKDKKGAPVTGYIALPNNQIWIKDLFTGELKMIGQGSYPKFSPDGSTIAFVKYDLDKSRTKETGTIWTMSIEGDNQRQLTDPNLGYAILPNWSPNGSVIIFQLTKLKKKDSDIYSIDINGENLTQYTSNKSNDFSPYWSEDNYIYFASDRGAKAKEYQIWRFRMAD